LKLSIIISKINNNLNYEPEIQFQAENLPTSIISINILKNEGVQNRFVEEI